MFRPLIPVLMLALIPALIVLQGLSSPLMAQTPPTGNKQTGDEPALRDRLDDLLDRFRRQVDPDLNDLRELMGDPSGWHAPEVLPNGDILIRRRRAPESSPETPPETAPQSPEGDAPVTEPFTL